ncbi:hypothetical protein F4778DRAFT_759997 [Xylariomycetidae sp. FL2044]|nr:hypothetical protein F4778DRAFT_759997 [Xylariomycetidae sp. FL2044]
MTQDAEIVKEICSFEPVINRQDELGSDEWLYGRAGYLYFLRLCRATSMTWSTSSGTIPMLDRAMRKTVHRILAAPQPWTWHGKQYLGAAHGAIGIICQLVLTLPSIAPHLRPLLSSILTEQYTTGNFPSSENSGSDQLVQFCHGGPGFVISLRSLLPYYPDLQDTMIRVIKKAESDIWKRGLLTKEPCLCHGIAGNALALDDPDRFMHFLSFMSDSAMVQAKSLQGSTSKDKTAGLYTGEAGRSWTWAVASRQAPKTLIAYNDV